MVYMNKSYIHISFYLLFQALLSTIPASAEVQRQPEEEREEDKDGDRKSEHEPRIEREARLQPLLTEYPAHTVGNFG